LTEIAKKHLIFMHLFFVKKSAILVNSKMYRNQKGIFFKNAFTLIIHTDSKEEVDRLFGELSQNGQIKVPVGLTFWGAYYGQCTDKFDISWKITLASKN